MGTIMLLLNVIADIFGLFSVIIKSLNKEKNDSMKKAQFTALGIGLCFFLASSIIEFIESKKESDEVKKLDNIK